jgi:hypothetical protein
MIKAVITANKIVVRILFPIIIGSFQTLEEFFVLASNTALASTARLKYKSADPNSQALIYKSKPKISFVQLKKYHIL